MQLKKINRVVKILILYLAMQNIAIAQERFSLAPTHIDCSAMLTVQRPITAADIHDFLKTETFEIKLVRAHSVPTEGGAMNDLNVVLINKGQFDLLTQNKALLEKYRTHITWVTTQLSGFQGMPVAPRLITTLHDKQDIVTYFHFEGGKLVAYAHILPTAIKQGEDISGAYALQEELKYAKSKMQPVIWMGDQISLPIQDFITEMKMVVFRRATGINKPILVDQNILEKDFNPHTSIICNAVPSTARQLADGGFPISRLSEWKKFKNEITQLTHGHFAKSIHSLAELKEELLTGSNDLVMVIAHLKNNKLYIGDEIITLDALKKIGKRQQATNGQRIGILSICNAGNQNYKVGSLFWQQKVDPISSIFLENGYFDMVLAPDHTINRLETNQVLRALLEKKPFTELQASFPIWGPWVCIIFNNQLFALRWTPTKKS